MARVFASIALLTGLLLAGEALAQAKPASYEALSTANRRIVSAIYEAQLGSRRDRAGRPLLSKDEITAMRRSASWDDVYQRLAARGYVVSGSLADATHSFERDTVPSSRLLIISTAAGDQLVVNRYNPSRTASSRGAPSRPEQANILPAPAAVRPTITVVDLPVATAGEPAARATTQGGAVDRNLAPVIAGVAQTPPH